MSAFFTSTMKLRLFGPSLCILISTSINLAVELTDTQSHREGAQFPLASTDHDELPTPLSSTSTECCPTPSVLSCSSDALSTDSCCVLKPGGSLVHAQFWDRNVGQPNSWGVHGLWPDTCDGAFYEHCDASRAYSGAQIVQALQDADAESTLEVMRALWLSDDESPEMFWEHEWGTHGTCRVVSKDTKPHLRCAADFEQIDTRCEQKLQVVPYFKTVMSLFKTLNTYDALAQANITPSETRTYPLSELQEAVYSYTGYTPTFSCSGTALKSVEYFLRVQGPLQNGVFMQLDPDSSVLTARDLARSRRGCPEYGIVYNVKDFADRGGDGSQHRGHHHDQPSGSRDEF